MIEILESYAGESNAVLSVEMARQMLTPSPDGWYGLGFFIIEAEGRTRFQHPGWNEGYHAFVGGDMGTGQGVAWMSNGENGILLGLEMMRGLARILGWPGFESQEKVVAPIDPAVYARYEGEYRSVDDPDYGVMIVREDNRLFLKETPDGIRYELYPESDTSFFSCERWEQITFTTTAASTVEGMMFGEHERLERVN